LVLKPIKTSALQPAITKADELFVNIDGSVLRVGESWWRVDVCGIFSSGIRNWIQVHVVGYDEYGVTLATNDLSPCGVRDRLVQWLTARIAPSANAHSVPQTQALN
jgi:hypothetical protein